MACWVASSPSISASSSSSFFFSFFYFLFFCLPPPTHSTHGSGAVSFMPQKAAPGLSYGFYKDSCPSAHRIIAQRVREHVRQVPSEAAGLLRILFHDCFVQGCDASILLAMPFSEQEAPPNDGSLRTSSIQVLDRIKDDLEAVCPGVVSCADIIAIAARHAVYSVGGPLVPMPSGRRDSLTAASNQVVISSLPAPTFNFSNLKKNFLAHGLNVHDLVALSGAHSIGQAHCKTVDLQLIPQFSVDLDRFFVPNVSRVCLPASSKTELTIHMDFISEDRFDNNYFKNVIARRALFHSDAALLDDQEARSLVELYAHSQAQFFSQFSVSMLKMSQLNVLTGAEGEVRRKCFVSNKLSQES